jgi:hypothetical protein
MLPACAATITFTGLITQSTPDGTGPASNNPGLNAIQDGMAYTVTLDLSGSGVSSIHSPGLYSLTGAGLTFRVPSAAATENLFDSITLAVSQAGGVDTLTLLACLTTGSGCAAGNQLSADFAIPAAGLNGTGVAATGLDPPHPVDLLEDDGVTDIHGSVVGYSYSESAPAPEPATMLLVSTALAGCGVLFKFRYRANR